MGGFVIATSFYWYRHRATLPVKWPGGMEQFTLGFKLAKGKGYGHREHRSLEASMEVEKWGEASVDSKGPRF